MTKPDLYTWDTGDKDKGASPTKEEKLRRDLGKALDMVERELEMDQVNALAKKYRSDT